MLGFIFFWGGGATRMACSYYSNSLPSVGRTLSLLTLTAGCVWATVQTKVNRCVSPGKRQKKRLGGRRGEVGEAERWRWRRDSECDSVMQAGFGISPPSSSALGRSLAHNMESINPHRIPVSPLDICPVCLSVCLFTGCSYSRLYLMIDVG